MIPDMQCTAWPDGIPSWLGGSGTEFLECCIQHDLTTAPWLAADLELLRCMSSSGYTVIGIIMFTGLVTIGTAYRAWVRLRGKFK